MNMMKQTRARVGRNAFFLVGWAALASIVLAMGCAGVEKAPGWVNGEEPEEYPKQKFLTALGTGTTLEVAKVAAKAELSRIFSSQLRSEIALVEEETVADGKTKEASSLLVDTRIATEIDLEGAEVPLHWRDENTGEIWAMAVLDRRKECKRIGSVGEDLVTRLSALRTEAEEAENPLLVVRALAIGLRVSGELDGLQARSRVLGSDCVPERPVSTGGLRSELDARMAGLSFVVNAENVDAQSQQPIGPLPQLREQIAGNLTRRGFQVGPSTGADVVPIRAWLRIERVQRGTDWAEYRWEGSAEIRSPEPGEPALVVAESEGAESHPEASTAWLRARRKGEQELAVALDDRLRKFLQGAVAR